MPAKAPPVNAARQGRVNWETRASLNTSSESQVHEIPLWRRVAIWPLAALVRLWAASVRVTITGEAASVLAQVGGPAVFLLWHNRLFMAARLHRQTRPGRRFYGLVSASRDGAWLAAFFSACGLYSVRGSSSRRGREAVWGLVDVLRAGNDIGITPDGPRGPVYTVKPGALVVARRSGADLVMVGIDYESSWRVRSWDGFHLPRPFSRAILSFRRVDAAAQLDRDEGALKLAADLAAINPDRLPAPVRRTA